MSQPQSTTIHFPAEALALIAVVFWPEPGQFVNNRRFLARFAWYNGRECGYPASSYVTATEITWHYDRMRTSKLSDADRIGACNLAAAMARAAGDTGSPQDHIAGEPDLIAWFRRLEGAALLESLRQVHRLDELVTGYRTSNEGAWASAERARLTAEQAEQKCDLAIADCVERSRELVAAKEQISMVGRYLRERVSAFKSKPAVVRRLRLARKMAKCAIEHPHLVTQDDLNEIAPPQQILACAAAAGFDAQEISVLAGEE